MNRHKYEGAILALLGLIGSSATAMAQNAPAAQPAQPTQTAATGDVGIGLSAGTTTTPVLDADTNAQTNAPTASAPAQPVVAAAPVAEQPPPLPPPVEAAAQTDHERVVGAIGIGYLGERRLLDLDTDGESYSPRAVQVIGARLWLNKSLGLQFGLGLAHHSGTASSDVSTESDINDRMEWAFALHAAVPLALYDDKHYSFLILPEANFGMSTWRRSDDGNVLGDQGISGRAWLMEVGARAGAEIHFGFIGIPMLSLEGTVGAHLSYRDAGVEYVDPISGAKVTRGRYELGLETTSYEEPWDLFTGSIAALYYFK